MVEGVREAGAGPEDGYRQEAGSAPPAQVCPHLLASSTHLTLFYLTLSLPALLALTITLTSSSYLPHHTAPPTSIGPCRLRASRREGGTDHQLRVLAEAQPEEFVGTQRLEENAGGAAWCTWRNILAGYYRNSPLPPP